MKAFVTGGTGFLGTHLIQELDQAGWEIIALHRGRSDLTELKKCRRVEFAQGDVTDIESIRRGMPEGVDAVFHCRLGWQSPAQSGKVSLRRESNWNAQRG